MSKQVLTIDDHPTNIELMVFLLKAFGYRPMMAFDGATGIHLAKINRPDLILCDIDMPGLSGIQVVREVKRLPELQNIPILAVTAMAEPGDAERLLSLGFDGYVPKPIEPAMLRTYLEKFV